MERKEVKFKTRSKYLLTNLILSFIILWMANIFAVNEMREKLDKTYSLYAQDIIKIIAAQTFDIQKSENFDSDNKSYFFSELYSTFLKDNKISYIEYKDKDNKLIYSSKNDFPVKEISNFNISSPVGTDNNIAGSITIGMSEKEIQNIIKSLSKSITAVFIIIWLITAILMFLNSCLLSKELKKIYKGVKLISTGQFGYKLESENMPELVDAFNDMSNLLSQYEEQNIEQLTLERNKLEAVLMSIINGVIVCDNFDNVVLANSAALSMLDIQESNFINTKIQDYIDSHGQKCFFEKIEEFKDTPLNIIEQKPIEFNIEAGKKIIKAMISPMFSKQQDYVGYIIVLLDITRETEVNKLKNTFISNVSHELRTPVTVLRTYIDTLCHNSNDFDEITKQEFMNTIDTEAKRLHNMVNDILDFSRLESGSITLTKEFADLAELISLDIKSIKILADEKNINITFTKEGEIPKIPINIESMERVIRNLLSNAIKYSNEGKNIAVNIKMLKNKEFVEFSVKDNGIGIAKEHLEKIFDRFYRVENATHTVKGTGLGLHLVKLTVEKYHNGKITVESKENEGSTFTVILPVNVSTDELI